MFSPTPPTVQVVVAVVVRDGTILIGRRRDDGRPLAGYWEFPGGKVEPGEQLVNALHRELIEELDLTVVVDRPLTMIRHAYPKAIVELYPFLCVPIAGDPKPLAVQELRWVTADALTTYTFPPANATLLEEVVRTVSGNAEY